MRSIRTIHSEETEEFLSVLCKVFDLSIDRARSVFYQEPGYDLQRKWALFEDGRITSILTTSPIVVGHRRGIGIAGVGTITTARKQGLAQQLLEHVLEKSREAGEEFGLLFAQNEELYRRSGFETLDRVVHGSLKSEGHSGDDQDLPFESVRKAYDQWADAAPNRLIRTDLRWSIWQWGIRSCEPIGPGYICYEGTTVREALMPVGLESWPVPIGTLWTGLEQTTKSLEVPVQINKHDLYLMGVGISQAPEMFLTDQF